jgi:HEPN domain-containing protein
MAYDYRNWIGLAESDLRQARHSLEGGGFHVAAFLAHQVAEQCLKGLWIVRGPGLPPRSHNLVELARGLDAPGAVVTACVRLAPHYMSSRYPDIAEGNPADNYDEAAAAALVADGEEVFRWCSSRLPS